MFYLKAGFHMIAERRSQTLLRSAIIWKPAFNYKVILEKREERINSVVERNDSCSVLAHFGDKNARSELGKR